MDNVLSQLTGLFGEINENIVSKKEGIVEKGEFLSSFFLRPELLFADHICATARNRSMDIM